MFKTYFSRQFLRYQYAKAINFIFNSRESLNELSFAELHLEMHQYENPKLSKTDRKWQKLESRMKKIEKWDSPTFK